MTLPSTVSTLRPDAPPTPLALVADDLARVETRIRELVASRETRLSEVAGELIGSGGKRVRPALSLLVFRAAGGDDATDVIDIGAALELIHSATLLHDDILDSGMTRRGRPSPLARHGVGLTLVTGDFLFSKAFGVAGRFDAMVVGWATDACIQLCEGEILQQRFRRNPDVQLADYLEVAEAKTASLFSQAARIGAHLAGADPALVHAMYRAGYEVGLGFQMVDDLLDVLGPPEVIGKPVGSDLREGSPALPTVLALPHLPAVRAAFLAEEPDALSVERALDALRGSTVLDEVRRIAEERIRSARAELDRLPPSAFRDGLHQLADLVLERTA
ncbi:MAG: polyprenyl synthetase family protein [Deltaproteobacteria bacterium]|nr:polyprenyl synthetase family protein [Deltaproteobacteria bacterium]